MRTCFCMKGQCSQTLHVTYELHTVHAHVCVRFSYMHSLLGSIDLTVTEVLGVDETRETIL